MERFCPKCFNKFGAEHSRCPKCGKTLIALTDRDLVGEELDDRYLIKSVLGRGGMGVVYVAEQSLIGREVALKVLRRDMVQDETSVKRFLREAKAIASLKSSHTVTLHDFGVTGDGLLYYTMELLEGRSLARIIKDEGPIEHRRAAGLVLQACESLEEAHEKNILHRDLKPDNVFVGKHKGLERVTVLDFGIAKILGDTPGETLTDTGMICGTPAYLSPEQAMGTSALKASDLYSMAIIFYEMLAGEPPFMDTTPMKVLMKHVNEQPRPVTVRNSNVEVPESVDRFLRKALEKDPGNRFTTVNEFRKALEETITAHEEETVTIAPIATTGAGIRVITDHFLPDAPEMLGTARTELLPFPDASGPAQRDETDPKTDDAASTDGPPIRAEIRQLLFGRRIRTFFFTGVLALTAISAVIAVWRPWQDKPEEPEPVAQIAEEPMALPGEQQVDTMSVEDVTVQPDVKAGPPADVVDERHEAAKDTGAPLADVVIDEKSTAEDAMAEILQQGMDVISDGPVDAQARKADDSVTTGADTRPPDAVSKKTSEVTGGTTGKTDARKGHPTKIRKPKRPRKKIPSKPASPDTKENKKGKQEKPSPIPRVEKNPPTEKSTDPLDDDNEPWRTIHVPEG